jgi:hypothetical protein
LRLKRLILSNKPSHAKDGGMMMQRPPKEFKRPSLVLAMGIVVALSIAGCSATGNVRETPEFKLVETTLAKGINDAGGKEILLAPTQTFSTNDTKVVAYVKFANVSGRHSVNWKWYGPNGKLYSESKPYQFKTAQNRYVESASAWHTLSIKGDEAQNHPGDWSVKIFYDDRLMATKAFTVRAEGTAQTAPLGLPPILSISEISFSKPVLHAGETAEIKVTMKNTGPGDANDVYLELYSDSEHFIFPGKKELPVIPQKDGGLTVTIPVEGKPELVNGTANLDILVVEPHFRVKIKGKRLTFHTRQKQTPKLILARFAALESESSARNQQIDINEVIDIKIAVQNVGDGTAEDVKLDLLNNQTGVMFLGHGEGQVLSRERPQFSRIDSGKHQIVNYRFFVNSDFTADTLEFLIRATERSEAYGFTENKRVKINTELKPEGYIRQVAAAGGVAGSVIVEDISDFEVDVDVNIPQTAMNNPNAVAVIIGNRNYQHKDIPAVQYARRDADIMKQYLVKTLGYKEGNILFETDASKAKFEALFGIRGDHHGILNDYVKPKKSDVFIYYSGHGAPDLKNMKGYFVPVDCDPAKVSLNGYALDLFYENLSKMEARTLTVVMDACFSGSTNSGSTLVQSASPALIRIDTSIAAKKNAAVLTSSAGDQVSSWYDEKRHGLFTYFFLKAMGGDADKNKDNRLTFQEIQDYVADRSEGVPYWAKRLHGGRTQTPTLIGGRSTDVLVQF